MRFVIWVRKYFGFSRTETNGYLVLLTLLAAIHFGTQYYLSVVDWEGPALVQFISEDTARVDHRQTAANRSADTTELLQEPRGSGRAVQLIGGKKIVPLADQVDLNQVDSVWLQKIYGIGPVLSKRIIKYRNLLGGFYTMDQLSEVYRLPPEVIETLKNRVYIDLEVSPLEKLNINTMDYLQMAAHPYLAFDQAKAIASYRQQHGSFNRLEDLKKIHLMDDSTYLRVRPYLDF